MVHVIASFTNMTVVWMQNFIDQTGKQIHIHEVSKTQVSPSNSTGAKGRISRWQKEVKV